MKKYYSPFLIALASICIMTCKNSPQHSTDFTQEFSFTKGVEGPAVNKNGDVFAVNFEKEGTIGIVNTKGEGRVFLSLPNESIGNGIRFDLEGNMFIADYVNHNVYRVDKGTNTPSVWAHNPNMNQPNDLAINDQGILYLSDPNWEQSTGNIWMVNTQGDISLLEANMGTANGIEVSPNGKTLYVNESVQRKVWQYTILDNGTVTNKQLLISFDDFGLDGMRCDTKGNLYIARYGKGTVIIISPEGKRLDEITLTGKNPSNIAFGGKDGKTCFVTMADRGNIETFKAPFSGSYFNKINAK